MFNRINTTMIKTAVSTKPVDVQPDVPRMTLTVEQVAEELHISRPTAYDLVEQEGFPSFRIGTRILVSRKGLEEWIDKQTGSRNVEQ